MTKTEISVLAELKGRMVLVDRVVIEAANTRDAALKYAALFETERDDNPNS